MTFCRRRLKCGPSEEVSHQGQLSNFVSSLDLSCERTISAGRAAIPSQMRVGALRIAAVEAGRPVPSQLRNGRVPDGLLDGSDR